MQAYQVQAEEQRHADQGADKTPDSDADTDDGDDQDGMDIATIKKVALRYGKCFAATGFMWPPANFFDCLDPDQSDGTNEEGRIRVLCNQFFILVKPKYHCMVSNSVFQNRVRV